MAIPVPSYTINFNDKKNIEGRGEKIDGGVGGRVGGESRAVGWEVRVGL